MTRRGCFLNTRKILSILICFTFLWNQISWAGDLTNYSVDDLIDRQHEDQSSRFSPEYVRTQDNILKGLIELKQEIEYCALENKNTSPDDTALESDLKTELHGPSASADAVQPLSSPIVANQEDPAGVDPSGPPISLTTEAGDVIYYENNEIVRIEKENGTVISEISCDGDELIDARVEYPDGTLQIVREGEVKELEYPNGTKYFYDDNGRISAVDHADGGHIDYSYVLDGEENVLQTVLIDDQGNEYVYNSNDRLERAALAGGKIVEYADGLLKRVIDGDTTYRFESEEEVQDDSVIYVVSLCEIEDIEHNIYRIHNNAIYEVETSTGAKYSLGAFLTGDYNLDGYVGFEDYLINKWGMIKTEVTYFDGDANRDGDVNGRDLRLLEECFGQTARVADSTNILFDASGNLVLILHDDGTKEICVGSHGLFTADDVNSFIVLKDGDNIINDETEVALPFGWPSGLFSFNGHVSEDADLSGISYFDAITYDSGMSIIQIEKYNGDVITYEDGLIDTVLSSNSSTRISYSLDRVTGSVGSVTVDRDGIQRIYDRYGNIESISLDEETRIVYENGEVAYIEKADGTRIKNLTFSDTGELFEGIISGPDGSLSYYNDNVLIEMINNITGESVQYNDDGTVHTINLNDGTTYEWDYEDDGRIKIHDLSNNEYRWYLNGQLRKVEELEGACLTINYEYDDDGQLVSSNVSKGADVLYKYDYTYEDGLTLVHDEDGNIQAYNSDKKLSYIIDSFGKKFAYRYVDKHDDSIEVFAPGGNRVTYDNDGNLISIVKPDGVVIEDIVITDGIPASFKYTLTDNTRYFVKDGILEKSVSGDGNITTFYYENGYVSTVIDADTGEEIDYEYEIPDSVQPSISEVLTYQTDGVIFYDMGDGKELRLELDDSDVDWTVDEDMADPPSSSAWSIHAVGDNEYEDLDGMLRIVTYGSEPGGNGMRTWRIENGRQVGIDTHYTIDFRMKLNSTDSRGNAGIGWGDDRFIRDECINFFNDRIRVGSIGEIPYDDWDGYTFDPTDDFHDYRMLVANGYGRFYVDGELKLEGVFTQSLEYYTHFYFGAGCNSSGGASDTVWDHVRIYGENLDVPLNKCIVPVFESSGSITSNVIEVNAETLDSISWNETLERHTDIYFQTRTGSTLIPNDNTWSDWSDPIYDSYTNSISSVPDKFIQFRAVLSADNDNEHSPKLRFTGTQGVTINYESKPATVTEISADITRCFDLDGNLIWEEDGDGTRTEYDPPDTNVTVEISGLKYDSSVITGLNDVIIRSSLSETQRQIYYENDIIVAEMVEIESIDGIRTLYSEGKIVNITLMDGTIVNDIDFDEEGVSTNFEYAKTDGSIWRISNGTIREIEYSDGSKQIFDPNGCLSEEIDPSGRSRVYEYEIPRCVTASIDDFNSYVMDNAILYAAASDCQVRLDAREDNIDWTISEELDDMPSSDVWDYQPSVSLNSAELEDGMLHITTDSDALRGWWQNHTQGLPWEFTIEFRMKLVESDDNGNLGVGWADGAHSDGIRFHSDYLSLMTLGNFSYDDLDIDPANGFHIYRIVRHDHHIQVYIDGELKIDSDFQQNKQTDGTFLYFGALMSSAGGRTDSYWDYIRFYNSTFILPEYQSSGSVVSDVIELEAETLLDMSWDEYTPDGTDIQIQTRTGGTLEYDDGTWSEWSTSMTDNAGDAILSPNDRYFQYRILLNTNDPQKTPKVTLSDFEGINIGYTVVSNEFDDISEARFIRIVDENITRCYDETGYLLWIEDSYGTVFYNDGSIDDSLDIGRLTVDDTYFNEVAADVTNRKLPDEQRVITVYDKGNDTPVQTISSDLSITYFEDGYAMRVEDKEGKVLLLYTYDDDNMLISTELPDAREKLEEGYQAALDEIIENREEALLKLGESEVEARENIEYEVHKLRLRITAERERINRERAKFDPNIYDLSEFDRVLREIDQYEADLAVQEAQAYIDLDCQVAEARQNIMIDAQNAVADLIEHDYNVALGEIVQRESSPVIYCYYRHVLGRDPDDAELGFWLNKAKEDLAATDSIYISQYLETSDEYREEYQLRYTRKDGIIGNVEIILNSYLTGSDTDKQILLDSIGLGSSDLSNEPITRLDIDEILAWLNDQTPHFGDSAIETVFEILRRNGIDETYQEIARDCIVIDVLTGVITKETEGDLVISLFAMNKVAETNGVDLFAEKINFDELSAQLQVNDNIILHINRNHYVVLKEINDDDGTVTYIDHTVGKEGTDVTVSRAEFMEEWEGIVLSQNEIINTDDDSCRYLNVSQEKNIRGSGWWEDFWKGIVKFFQMIIAPVATILMCIPGPTQIIGAALHGLNMIIQTVSFAVNTGSLMDVVWAGIHAVGAGLTSFAMQGASTAASLVETPLKGLFSSEIQIFKPITDFVGGISTNVASIFTPLLGETISASLATNIIATSVQIGTSLAFESMKLDSTFSRIASSLFSGFFMGIMDGGTALDLVSNTLKWGSVAAIREIGLAADLDVRLVNLAAIASGSLVGGYFDVGEGLISASDLVKSISTNVAAELAYIGVQDLAETVGIDSRLSYVAGIGIRSSLRAGWGTFGSGGEPGEMWDAAMTGLAQGVASIGFNYLTEELDIDPLLANMGFSAISLGLEAIINGTDIFKHISDSYEKNATTFLGHNPKPTKDDFMYYDPSDMPVFNEAAYNTAMANYYWQESVYISQIQDFSSTIDEYGIVYALNNYATGFFSSVAVNSVVNIGDYIKDKLISGDYTLMTMDDGKTVRQVDIEDTGESALISNDDLEWLRGKTFNGQVIYGDIGVDPYGKIGLTDGYISEDYGDELDYYMDITNTNPSVIRIGDGTDTILRLSPGDGNDTLVPDGNGGYSDVTLEEYMYNRRWEFMDHDIIDYGAYTDTGEEMFRFDMTDPSQVDFLLYSPYMGYDDLNLLDFTPHDKMNMFNCILYVGGIINPYPEHSPATNMISITQQFANADPGGSFRHIHIPVFETTPGNKYLSLPLRRFVDGVKWLNDVYYFSDLITNDVITETNKKFNHTMPDDMTWVLYSGGGDPGIQAINKMPDWDVDTVMLVGSQLRWGRKITNPNTNRVIMIKGELDWESTLYGEPFQDFEGSINEIDTYKIVLKGVGHTDYTYEPSLRPEERDPLKVKASRFIAEIGTRSTNVVRLEQLLRKPGIIKIDDKYIVDLNELTYDE